MHESEQFDALKTKFNKTKNNFDQVISEAKSRSVKTEMY